MSRSHAATSPTGVVVRARGVGVRLGGADVLRDLDLTVERGEALALTGANGSGKSTLLRVLATLLRPRSGEVELLGHPWPGSGPVPAAVRQRVALAAHEPALHPDLTLEENLTLVARLARVPTAGIEEALAGVGLGASRSRTARACSEGMRRRAELARVRLTRPDLLLLDEVHAALDVSARGLVEVVVGEVVARGGAAVVVTHDLDAVAPFVTRAVAVARGRLVPAGLRQGVS